jgi:hypothetical protein
MFLTKSGEEVYLYHYNTKPLEELYTLEKQKELGINLDRANMKIGKMSKMLTFKYDDYEYVKHISFFIDPIPLKLVREHFTLNRTFQSEPFLYEHKIKLSEIEDNLLGYKLVETPIDNFYVDYFWDLIWKFKSTENLGKELYFNSKNMILKMLNYKGSDYSKLRDVVLKFKGATEKAYLNLVSNPNKFTDKQKGMYAPTVPHLFIYPKDGIVKVDGIKKVYFDN